MQVRTRDRLVSGVGGLQWSPEIKIGDLLTVIALLLTAAALAFTGYQIQQGRLASRHQFLFATMDRYFRDAGTRAFYYRLDHTEQPFSWKFDRVTFLGSADGAHLDYLLQTFALIEQMIAASVLKPSDVKLLGFEALRVIENAEVKKYLEYLDSDYDQILGPNSKAYADARNLASRFRDLRDEFGRSIIG